ncbi:MAG: MFS transporter [Sphingomicrobium sp.]
MSNAAATPPRTRLILGLLLLSYIFNFLDRQIVAILAIPIKADLKLSDTQLGLLGGIAFAALYSTLAIPLARLADRRGRVKVIAAAVAVWSGFTALCGVAGSFTQLFLARMGVGIGEAGGVAPSYALISDLVPPARRARALAIFSLGIPIGSALGLFFGGWLAQNFNWRTAFVAIGLAGIPVALLIRAVVPETERSADTGKVAPLTFAATIALLARKPSFWLLAFGAAAASICGYGFGFWLPRHFLGHLGLSLTEIGVYFGSIVLIGGMAGIYGGGWVADRLVRTRGVGGNALVPGIAFLLCVPLYAAALSTSSLTLAWPLFALPYALSLTWLGPIVSAVQNLVEPRLRATASSAFLLINNLLGIGFGTFMFGFLSDRLAPHYGDDALRTALMLGIGFYALAGLLCLLAARRLALDSET